MGGVPAAGSRRFRVALSFSGAQGAYVAEVAEYLCRNFDKAQLFYWPWHEPVTNGIGTLGVTVPEFYLLHSDISAAFLSAEYARSNPCNAEWRALMELIYTRQSGRLMLFRFDMADMPMLQSYDAFTPVENRPAREVADMIYQRWQALQANPPAIAASRAHDRSVLKQIVGERVLALLVQGPLQKLCSVGNFLRTELDPSQPLDVIGIVDELHAATELCLEPWRRDYRDSTRRIRQDCLLLLGELLKLGVNKEFLAKCSPHAPVELACRMIGTAVTAYCALADLPLMLAKPLENGFDVASGTLVNLDKLGGGVGTDTQGDIYDALWLAAGNQASGSGWTPQRVAVLKRYLAQHWRRYRTAYVLMLGEKARQQQDCEALARELAVGFIIRSEGAGQVLQIGEEDLVALACDYLKLLDSL